ncbi:hypothetical protein [Corallococcus sp. CA031C]|nr:hypothetical protein [Corallococcus sp. CA031C]
MVFQTLGLPVFARGESGGWGQPSLLGWLLVAAVWWGVVSLVLRAWASSGLLKSR